MQTQSLDQAPKQNTEFQNLFTKLQDERIRYMDILNRLSTVGHRIKDTNTPTQESANKPTEPFVPGVINDFYKETIQLGVQNDILLGIVNKLEGLI